jgi:hypothetical protein
MKTSDGIKVDKILFTAWFDGDIPAKRDELRLTKSSMKEFEAAKAAMDRGETIQLTDIDGTVVAEMLFTNGAYTERMVGNPLARMPKLGYLPHG